MAISRCILYCYHNDTAISEAWGSVSWLDHIVSSSDFHNCIKTVSMTCLMRMISPSLWISLSMTFLALLAVMKAAIGGSAGTNLMQMVALNIVLFRMSSLVRSKSRMGSIVLMLSALTLPISLTLIRSSMKSRSV